MLYAFDMHAFDGFCVCCLLPLGSADPGIHEVSVI